MDMVYSGKVPDRALLSQLGAKDPGIISRVLSLTTQIQQMNEHNQEHMDPAQAAPVIAQIMSNTYPGASSRVDALTSAVTRRDLRIAPAELAGIYRQANEQDTTGIDRIPLVASLVDQLKRNGDPTLGGIKMFKDPNAIPRVISQFYSEVNQIRKDNPTADVAALEPKIRKAYDDTMNWNMKAFPSAFAAPDQQPSNIAVTPDTQQPQAVPQPTQQPQVNRPRADRTAGSPFGPNGSNKPQVFYQRDIPQSQQQQDQPQYQTPTPRNVQYLKEHPEARDRFIQAFGPEAYQKATMKPDGTPYRTPTTSDIQAIRSNPQWRDNFITTFGPDAYTRAMQ